MALQLFLADAFEDLVEACPRRGDAVDIGLHVVGDDAQHTRIEQRAGLERL